ncbi:MAG: endolytic transglycosylase MltG [Erysipelotrichaceae bacterium]
MKKKRNRLPLVVLLAFLLLAATGGYLYSSSLKAVSDETQSVIFEVNQGATTTSVLSDLAEEGLIKSELFAKIYVKLNDDFMVKEGVYEIGPSMSVDEILTYLSNASNALNDDVLITFVEGDWVKDMVDKIADVTNLEADELLAYWNDEEVIRRYQSDYPFLTDEMFDDDVRYYLEGYLYADTYYFKRETTNDEVTRTLLNGTLDLYNTYKDEIYDSEYTIHELFTLASIIQYEAVTREDMFMVSGVLQNRLDIDMALQVSVSVCYALDIDKGDDWTLCEVNPTYDSPYNTYLYDGLPPGPIMSFGKDAFEATLSPTQHDYYFFVADVYGDGGVYYATTYAEHLANIDRFGLGL